MEYFIFLKSLRSLEEFRKNPRVKIPPKSPCAHFQSLGIFKNQIIFGKEFSPSLSAHPDFQPSLFFFQRADFPSPPPLGLDLPAGPAHPHGPTGHLLIPPTPEPSAPGAAGRPHTAPSVDPDTSAIPFIPPLIDAVSPSSRTGNRRLQRRPLKTLGLTSAL
jgi:hypothetical protein